MTSYQLGGAAWTSAILVVYPLVKDVDKWRNPSQCASPCVCGPISDSVRPQNMDRYAHSHDAFVYFSSYN
jgi:hypothetical protein